LNKHSFILYHLILEVPEYFPKILASCNPISLPVKSPANPAPGNLGISFSNDVPLFGLEEEGGGGGGGDDGAGDG
jgi:hypothetical protein